MSLFKKPRRNVRQRQLNTEEEGSNSPSLKHEEEEDDSVASVKANIAKLKEKKKASKNRNQFFQH